MKTITFLFITLLCGYIYSQDTTSLRLVAITTWDSEDVLFFKDDTTDLYAITSSIHAGSFTSHGIFVNPQDGDLYAVADPDNFTGRYLYKINPLTGQFDSIMVVGDHPTSITVTPEGRCFYIEGNGAGVPGAIFELDLTNHTQTQVAVSSVPAGQPRAIIYNPMDTSLYVYSSYIDSVYIMKLDSWTESVAYAGFPGTNSVEVHGGFYKDNKFILCSYYNNLLLVNLSDSLGGKIIKTSNYHLMDITEFTLLKEPTNYDICLNDSIYIVLHARYSSNSYSWYKNDTLIPGANADSLVITDFGSYKLLTQIDTSNNYIWSEEVFVNPLNVPNVTLSAADTLWCPGDSILLTGSAGGTSQWYLNGVPIPGADTNIYFATTPGLYNMTKTNLNGCTDSASVGIMIVEDPNCGMNTDEYFKEDISIYPNPFNELFYINAAGNMINKIIITDIKGAVIYAKEVNNSFIEINSSEYSKGLYFVKLFTSDGIFVKKIIK